MINRITKVSSNPEKKFRKIPRVVWTGEGGFVHNSKNFEYPKKQLIQKTDIQIQILRDHIKKSNHRTYFSFVINLIIRVSSNPEEKFRKFPHAIWTEEGALLAIDSKKAHIQTLRDHIKNSNRRTYFSFVINFITKVSFNPEEKFRKFPRVVWTGEGALSAYR